MAPFSRQRSLRSHNSHAEPIRRGQHVRMSDTAAMRTQQGTVHASISLSTALQSVCCMTDHCVADRDVNRPLAGAAAAKADGWAGAAAAVVDGLLMAREGRGRRRRGTAGGWSGRDE